MRNTSKLSHLATWHPCYARASLLMLARESHQLHTWAGQLCICCAHPAHAHPCVGLRTPLRMAPAHAHTCPGLIIEVDCERPAWNTCLHASARATLSICRQLPRVCARIHASGCQHHRKNCSVRTQTGLLGKHWKSKTNCIAPRLTGLQHPSHHDRSHLVRAHGASPDTCCCDLLRGPPRGTRDASPLSSRRPASVEVDNQFRSHRSTVYRSLSASAGSRRGKVCTQQLGPSETGCLPHECSVLMHVRLRICSSLACSRDDCIASCSSVGAPWSLSAVATVYCVIRCPWTPRETPHAGVLTPNDVTRSVARRLVSLMVAP